MNPIPYLSPDTAVELEFDSNITSAPLTALPNILKNYHLSLLHRWIDSHETGPLSQRNEDIYEMISSEIARRLDGVPTEPTTLMSNTNTEPKTHLIPVDQILEDASLQMRAAGLDWDHVDDLKLRVEAEDPALRVILYANGTWPPTERGISEYAFHIGDGNHTVAAHRLLRKAYVRAEVRTGGYEHALYCALSANADQVTKPRTRKDIRRAVEVALDKLYFNRHPKPTQQHIADLCATTQRNVSNIIADILAAQSTPSTPTDNDTTPNDTTPHPQLTFFQAWDRNMSDAATTFERIFRTTLWDDPTYALDEKLKAFDALKASTQDKLRILEARLKKQAV